MSNAEREEVAAYDMVKLAESLRAIGTWSLYNDALGRAVLYRAANLLERIDAQSSAGGDLK